ncbi:MAG: hypothetical protein A2139_08040 [Desulfobacca sp. RBG_16_60_12]|nr:MAG: hypothetical protein A2139_08040 [Desulfobacca sp. RBG_16_60_12]
MVLLGDEDEGGVLQSFTEPPSRFELSKVLGKLFYIQSTHLLQFVMTIGIYDKKIWMVSMRPIFPFIQNREGFIAP